MTAISDRFELVVDEQFNFENVENNKSSRPDVHAFILLNELFQSEGAMICAAYHNVIYLNTFEEKLDTLTDDQILELTRCGVMYDSENDCLSMFV